MTVFFQLAVSCALALAVCAGAVGYFRAVRTPRPPVGVFNGADIFVMMGFVLALPYLYLALPGAVLPAVLAVAFAGGLSVGYQPVIGDGRLRWALIAALIAAVLGTHLAFGDTAAPYWIANSCVVGLVVVSATNISVQGGMRLRNVAWFLLALTAYDAFFAWVVPLTEELSDAVQGYPFAPAAGLRVGDDLGAVLGMGDLLAYALFTTAAYKAYGKAGLRTGIVLVVLFGAVAPVAALHIVGAVTGHAATLIPAQVFFGPAAFTGHLLLRRRGPERRMAELAFRRDRIGAPGAAAGPRHGQEAARLLG
ncbi:MULTISPECIES: hypothetical protein [Streptomyces]|uniref:hypothetical protein n=1 Tax=Streptomyces TaxID=1883 RepID=UPI00163C6E1C|nr:MULTISPECIES: hypothetical protein [Streptomyces]MBC2877604.1 hypothetical protein [Streptomyces sp. TYQ1024]UBI36162.1 hypothetical protein K7I03_06605 [Streptomyces mobaraensis]UKW28757.1 hypothetical protein MCU78_06590 [Streptomyces sp. TYQ1024]